MTKLYWSTIVLLIIYILLSAFIKHPAFGWKTYYITPIRAELVTNPVKIEKTPHRAVLSQETLLQKLIECESNGKNVEVLDSDGEMARGILQYHDKTWNWFSQLSGIKGNPMNEEDAKTMTRWALKNGFQNHWSCYKKIKV